ncbi:hypothetical protein DPMN_049091 [Dreissena polymorpha]|uniref:Uncharacterized protein n=1 Tax=Dreissena polymorpha TaxID=45954 RepID=A0A9D4DC17_DREPO|nr:hypothetical protein DPMN_049091 [Dreissena polymorpha]
MCVLRSISNKNMKRILILYALASITSTHALSDEPLIHVILLCKSTVEVSCHMDRAGVPSGSYGSWTFYRSRDGFEDMLVTARINNTKQECRVSTLKTTASTNCFCVEDNRVICDISSQSIAKAGDRWRCARFIDGYLLLSNTFTVPSQSKPKK